jgi:phage regulator Rha-like protein
MKKLLPLVKITSMSSVELAELTGKQHSNVLRDIRNMLSELHDGNSNLNPKEVQGVSVSFLENGMTKEIHLDKRYTLTLITGYSVKLRDAVIQRWQFLENELEVLKSRTDTKKRQLEAMEALSHLLPDDLSEEALSYIKANAVVNKAVSTLFGFPKMLKKAAMNPDMVQVRDTVLDDYIALFEVLQDNGLVKDAIYAKWQPKRITVETVLQVTVTKS